MNPIYWSFEHPALAATTLMWWSLLAGALVGLWWATTRNVIVLVDTWREGWYLMPTPRWAARLLAVFAATGITFGLLGAAFAAIP
jgi:hypothetical protein